MKPESKPVLYRRTARLTPAEAEEVEFLIDRCSQYDGTVETIDVTLNSSFSAFPDAAHHLLAFSGSTLIGMLSLFVPTPDEAEITGFVHPRWRGKGIFRELSRLAAAEAEHLGNPALIFVCSDSSRTGIAMLEKAGCQLVRKEIGMVLETDCPIEESGIELRKALADDFEDLVRFNCAIFDEAEAQARILISHTFASSERHCYLIDYNGTTVGTGCISFLSLRKAAMLFGFGILPRYRRLGLGKKAARLFGSLVRTEQELDLHLEVDSENVGALALYRSAGFSPVNAYRYYRRGEGSRSVIDP